MIRKFMFSIQMCLILIASFLAGNSFAADPLYVWALPPNFNSISGNIHSDVNIEPIGIYTYGLGDVTHPFNQWNVGDYTEFYSNQPLTNFQTGVDGNWPRATSFQLQENVFSAQMHTWSTPSYSSLKNATYGAEIGRISPWQSNYETPENNFNPKLCLTYSLTVPKNWPGGTAQYVTASIYIKSPEAGKNISIQISAWDNRGQKIEEYLGYDQVTDSNIIATFYGSTTKFATLMQNSATSQTNTFSDPKWMAACISKSNLVEIINHLNVNGRNFSTVNDCDGYSISGYGVQPEIATSAGQNG